MDVIIFIAGVALFAGCVAAAERLIQHRHNVKRVNTPAGVLVFFDCARCERRGQTWAADYTQPLCYTCEPAGMPS